MERLFLDVATLSLTCSLVLLPALLLARVFSRRYAARSLSVLWLLLALRLALPVSVSLPWAPVTITAPVYTLHLPAAADPAAGTAAAAMAPAATRSVDLLAVLAAVWLAGVALFLCYQMGAYVLARRKLLRGAEPGFVCSNGLRAVRSPGASTPMLLGLVRPVLVLPAEKPDADGLDVAIRHELCHLRRRDTRYKAVLLAANAVHWFNPLVWLMAREAARNLELCCDDDVLRGADRAERRKYGEALLNAASSGRTPALSTRFGSDKRELKERLGNLFANKRRGAGVVCVLLSTVLLVGALISCDTAPRETPPPPAPTASPHVIGSDVNLDDVMINDSAKLIAAAAEKQMGVDFPVIDYASEDLLVFHDYWGLAIYDFRQERIVRLADTPAIGMNLIQGDQYTEVRVAEGLDRMILFNSPPRALPEDAAWVYLLADDLLMETTVGQVEGEAYAKSTTAEGKFFFTDGAEPVMAELVYRTGDGAEYRVFERPEFDPGSGWQWPVAGYYTVTATFGARIHPLTGEAGNHTGTDIAAPENTPVQAARGGVVMESTVNDEDGTYVKLDHGDGTATRYCHMSSSAVEVGQTVEQGQTVGYVGSTGSATGFHLHFELWVDGGRADILTKYPNLKLTYR